MQLSSIELDLESGRQTRWMTSKYYFTIQESTLLREGREKSKNNTLKIKLLLQAAREKWRVSRVMVNTATHSQSNFPLYKTKYRLVGTFKCLLPRGLFKEQPKGNPQDGSCSIIYASTKGRMNQRNKEVERCRIQSHTFSHITSIPNPLPHAEVCRQGLFKS